MSITYPLSIPYPSPANVKVTCQSLVAMSQSQFTGSQQTQQWPGEWLEAEVTLPKTLERDGKLWSAFLAGLCGQAGTFAMGPAGTCIPCGEVGSIFPNFLRDCTNWLYSGSVPGGPHQVWNFSSNAGVVTASSGGGGGTVLSIPDTTGALQSVTISQTVPATVRNQWFTGFFFAQASATCNITLSITSGAQTFSFVYTMPTVTAGLYISGFFDQTTARSITLKISISGQPAFNLTLLSALLERAPAITSYYVAETNLWQVYGSGLAGQRTIQISGIALPSTGAFSTTTPQLCAGDWIQIGPHLHMVLNDVYFGPTYPYASIDIFPVARADIANGQLVTYLDPVGLWRLSENPRSFERSPGFPSNVFAADTIKCREVL